MAIDLNRTLSVLRSQLGYREGPRSNEQKYSPAVPGLEWSQYQPWCATFTCWVFLQAGGTAGEDFPLTASCLQQAAWGRSRGRLHTSPRVGDLVLFGPNGGTHVEVVTRVSGGTFWSIGGNTSGSWGGNFANGDGVYEKSRAVSAAWGFVRPVYGTATSEDDMPDYQEFTASGQALSAGTWETLKFDKRDGKSGDFWAVAYESRRVMLTAFATIDGAAVARGEEAQIRAALYRHEGTLSLPGGVLRPGARGADVKRVQTALITLGESLAPWGADGAYGDVTRKAVERVQRRGGLTGSAVDGVYGPTTRGVMEKLAPSRWVLARAFPLAQAVQSGGDLHLAYSLACDVPAGHRLRVRVAVHGGKPARVKEARAHVLSWER